MNSPVTNIDCAQKDGTARPIHNILDALEAMTDRLEMRATNVAERVDSVRVSTTKVGETDCVPEQIESAVRCRIRKVVERLDTVDKRLAIIVEEVEV